MYRVYFAQRLLCTESTLYRGYFVQRLPYYIEVTKLFKSTIKDIEIKSDILCFRRQGATKLNQGSVGKRERERERERERKIEREKRVKKRKMGRDIRRRI